MPHVISALCLNDVGLSDFTALPKNFENIFSIFTSSKYIPPLSHGLTASKLGSGFEELLRHQPKLRTAAVSAICKVLQRLVNMTKVDRVESALKESMELPLQFPSQSSKGKAVEAVEAIEAIEAMETTRLEGDATIATATTTSSNDPLNVAEEGSSSHPISIVYPIGSDRRLQLLYGVSDLEGDILDDGLSALSATPEIGNQLTLQSTTLEGIPDIQQLAGSLTQASSSSSSTTPPNQIRIPLTDFVSNISRVSQEEKKKKKKRKKEKKGEK